MACTFKFELVNRMRIRQTQKRGYSCIHLNISKIIRFDIILLLLAHTRATLVFLCFLDLRVKDVSNLVGDNARFVVLLVRWDRGRQGYGMLRNKVGIKKMITDNGLVSLIPSVEYRDPCCSSEYGIRWIRKVQVNIKRSQEKRRKDLPKSRRVIVSGDKDVLRPAST